MKTLKVSLLIFCVMTVFSCSQDGESISPNPPSDVLTDVSVTFSGFEVTVTPDARDDSNTRATANEANVTRIALKIFDSQGETVFSANRIKGVDDNFDAIDCQLPKGSYTFVAVAHRASSAESPNVDIQSATSASIPEKNLPKMLFSKVVNVTILGEDTQPVAIDFGSRITSSLVVKPKDASLEDVERVEIVVNPTGTAATDTHTFNPTTGFATSALSYRFNYRLSEFGLSSFTGQPFSVLLLLTAESQNSDVVISMYDSSDALLHSCTVSAVPFKPHSITTIEGYFFGTNVTNSFNFELSGETNTIIPMY